jgi:hypothetical protein
MFEVQRTDVAIFEHNDVTVVDLGSPSLQSQSSFFGFIAHPSRRRLLQMQWIRLCDDRAAVQACGASVTEEPNRPTVIKRESEDWVGNFKYRVHLSLEKSLGSTARAL